MGKVCSKAHGLKYVDEDGFIGARLGPEGECRSSLGSIPQPDGDPDLKMKTGESRYECQAEWGKDVKEKIEAGIVSDNHKLKTEKAKQFDDCDLIVELPPEDQNLGDSSSPHEDHISAKLKSGDTQAAVPHKSKDVCKVADESSKGNQDEWSYTVYDIDGGSKVTDQDLSHVMHSIKTAIGQSADHSICTNAKDSKILKIKVAVRPEEDNQPKYKAKRQKEFSRMILPPPGSEEAEMLCYYIREKLLTFVNQEEGSGEDVCRERKRGRRRNRCGSSGLGGHSPEVTCEANSKMGCHVGGNSECDLIKDKNLTIDTVTNVNQQRKHHSLEDHRDDRSRPIYGLPQRQDTYGGPIDSPLNQCSYSARKRSGCTPSSGTRSPQDSCTGSRGWPYHCATETGNHRCISEVSTKLSSFLHKDTYREVRKDESPGKCKRLCKKEQLADSLRNEIVFSTLKPLNSPRNGTFEQNHEPSKVCPCKSRVRRTAKQKKVHRETSTDESLSHDLHNSEENTVAPNETVLCDDTLTMDDVFSRVEVFSSDGTVSRDDTGHKVGNTRKESRSSAESRSDDGNTTHSDIRSREQLSQSSADTVLYNGLRWRDGRKLYGEYARSDETGHKDETRQSSSCSNDMTRSYDGTRSRDGCKSRDSSKSRDNYRIYDGARSRDDAGLETSSRTSTEISHSSSWKDQSAFTGLYYSTVHEWNSGQELSTDKMIRNMQSQVLQGYCGSHSPHSTDSNIGSPPKGEIVHRHEHHHYHYHIFKRS